MGARCGFFLEAAGARRAGGLADAFFLDPGRPEERGVERRDGEVFVAMGA